MSQAAASPLAASTLPDASEGPLPEGVAVLPTLGVIRVQGEDAAKFLHGQLTQDFALLGEDQARLAALCTARGRMQASFIGFKQAGGDVLLVTSADILPAVIKRLSMFVLRAKARLSDASAEFLLRGLAGAPARRLLGGEAAPWSLRREGAACAIALYPALGQPRALWVAPVGTPEPEGAALPADVWCWLEVRSGVATLSQPVVEAFVPQMLNYESVGGVNFKKGCYPGQEVVARSQFRGTLKRRAYLAHAPAALAPGQDVFAASDPDQPTGTVVQAAPAPGGGFDAIVSMQTASAQAELRAGSADGVALGLLPLPYALLDDI